MPNLIYLPDWTVSKKNGRTKAAARTFDGVNFRDLATTFRLHERPAKRQKRL